MNSKKAITLLVLTTMLLAMVPMVPVANAKLTDDITITNDSKPLLEDSGEKGNTIILEGDAGSVASGFEVSIFWDKIQDWDGIKGHLNTTEVDNDGGFEIWFKVPEAPVGSHYLWFTATDQETKVQTIFKVIPDCDISTSSGLAGSKIYVDLWGYAKNKEVAILFMDDLDYLTTNPYDEDKTEAAVDLYESDEDDYDGTLEEIMIQPGTVELDIERIGVLEHLGEGTATWTKVKASTGDDSVKLTAPIGGDYGKIVIPIHMDFEDLTSFSFWFMQTAGDAIPFHEIKVDVTEDDVATTDANIESGELKAAGRVMVCSQPLSGMGNTNEYFAVTPDTWIEFTESGSQSWGETTGWAIYWFDETGAFAGGSAQKDYHWSDIEGFFNTKASIQDIRVELRWPQVSTTTVYVDKITVNNKLVEIFITDSSDGNLRYLDDEDVGNINYITGEWSLDLGTVAGITDGAEMDVSYGYIDDETDKLYVITSSGQTNSLGSWEDKRVTLPTLTEGVEGKYHVVGFDGKNNQAYAGFMIGATITLSTDEGAVGDKIEVNGEGFKLGDEVTAYLYKGATKGPACHIVGSAGAETGTDKVDDDGEFEFYLIIPRASKKDDDYEIRISDTTNTAASDFEVTGLADVSVDPAFGPQGSSITVSGKNFQNIKDKKVKITLQFEGNPIATIKDNIKVDADGSFKVTCTVPTENDETYKIKVEDIDDTDGPFNIYDTVEFRIGTIMVLLSKAESVVGDKIVISGNGFTESGEWNATFGDVTIFSEEQASDTGLLRVDQVTPQFFVPQVQPGEYIITVWDVDAEIMVETEFTVTEYTVLDFELLEAPNEFNISIEGWNWPEIDTGSSYPINDNTKIDWVLYNETDDWEMDVRQGDDDPDTTDIYETMVAEFNASGYYLAWWIVPDDEGLDKGTYTVNATVETDNDQEYFMQLEFVIGDVHKYISPRKAIFRVGDTISFNIQHTFGNDKAQYIKGGDIKVFDPDGTLYWDGDLLDTWSKIETWYEVPYSAQTASDNPMVLLDDAPLGTWTYKWRENAAGDRDTIFAGTFNVEAGAEEVLVGQIEDLNQAIDDLTKDMTGVSDSVAGLKTDINSAIQAANAAVDASNKAIEAVNAGVAQSADAAEAAQRAEEAAGKAQEAAGGLTTLVYGAIGASLVAALAAIVSLMQISRRIAG